MPTKRSYEANNSRRSRRTTAPIHSVWSMHVWTRKKPSSHIELSTCAAFCKRVRQNARRARLDRETRQSLYYRCFPHADGGAIESNVAPSLAARRVIPKTPIKWALFASRVAARSSRAFCIRISKLRNLEIAIWRMECLHQVVMHAEREAPGVPAFSVALLYVTNRAVLRMAKPRGPPRSAHPFRADHGLANLSQSDLLDFGSQRSPRPCLMPETRDPCSTSSEVGRIFLRYITALLALVLLAASAPSPDISGTWQGTIIVPGHGKLPRVMRITKAGSGYDVKIYSTQESEVPIATRNVKIDGSTITMAFDLNSDPWLNYCRTYQATLSSDGKSLVDVGSTRRAERTDGVSPNTTVTLHILQPTREPLHRRCGGRQRRSP